VKLQRTAPLGAAWCLAISTVAMLGNSGCGGASPSTKADSSTGTSAPNAENRRAGGSTMRAAVDPLPFLREPPPVATRTWVKPRAARLDLGDRASAPDSEGEAIEVMLVEPGATMVRVAVSAPAARFVVWVERRDLFGVMGRDVQVRADFAPPTGEIGATLRQGAAVEILERTAERSRVRYSGALELETWVPNDSLAAEAEPVDQGGASVSGKMLHAAPGLAIRAEPRWGSQLLAALARTYFVSEVRAIDDVWSEVQYSDRAISVRGYASRRDPPVRLASRAPTSSPLPALELNNKLTAGTCLYARVRGEVVGIANEYAVAAAPDESEGWWTVTMETPWGPMSFAARRAGAWQGCEPPS
jgi:hypothetical protein